MQTQKQTELIMHVWIWPASLVNYSRFDNVNIVYNVAASDDNVNNVVFGNKSDCR